MSAEDKMVWKFQENCLAFDKMREISLPKTHVYRQLSHSSKQPNKCRTKATKNPFQAYLLKLSYPLGC